MKTTSIGGPRCDLDTCRKPVSMRPEFMLARGRVGTGLVGPVLAGIGILGSEATPFFPRTEFSGVPSGGDFTRRFSFIGLHSFWVRIFLIVLGNSTVRMDMAMERQGE